MKNEINIRPDTGVYATYKRISYKPWTAFAEFVDNSTQSFFDNKEELLGTKYYDRLTIEINYSEDKKNGDTIEIKDNAFGMEINDFRRALILNKPPQNVSGRNEFGMGLKTAASWFGNVWSVESTQLGSTKKYFAEIDIDLLTKYKNETIEFLEEEVSRKDHFTVIKISKLNRSIRKKTEEKVKRLLTSIYRQDLRNKDIQIFYNGESLEFDEVPPYKDSEGKVWKKDVMFDIEHEDKKLHVKGFVAIRIPGSPADAGYTLLRRGRVIIGGPYSNYRPSEVFGASTTFSYQRLYGELNLDDWPVTQAKDDFDWSNDELENKFILKLNEISEELKIKANEIRTKKVIPLKELVEDFKNNFDQDDTEFNDFSVVKSKRKFSHITQVNDDQANLNSSFVEIEENAPLEIVYKDKRNEEFKFLVELDTSSKGNWLNYSGNMTEDKFHIVRLNISHPFFFPYTSERNFLKTMVKFSVALLYSEIKSKSIAIDGKISPSTIRVSMNEVLEELSKNER